jgi:hypothetical protein
VPNGAVKWFTRRSRPASTETDSRRRLVRAALRARQRIASGDQTGHAASGRALKRPRYRCAECGYGIVASGDLPSCPMCKASDWVPDVSAQVTGASPPGEKRLEREREAPTSDAPRDLNFAAD